MNKIVIGVIVAVFVIGGGWYLMSGSKTETVGTTPQSMNELLSGTEKLECAFTETNDQAETSGTVYVADGMIRGDFVSKVPNSAQTIESHFITDGKKISVWTSLLPGKGVDMPVNVAGQANQVDFDKKLNYTCKSWSKDASKFTKPADIQFIDSANIQVPPTPEVPSSAPGTSTAPQS